MTTMKLVSLQDSDFSNKSFENVASWNLIDLTAYSAVKAYDGSKSMLITDSGVTYSTTDFFFLRLATNTGATIAEFGICDDWIADDVAWQNKVIDISAYAGYTGYVMWGLKDNGYPPIPEAFYSPGSTIFGKTVNFYFWREVTGGKKVYVDYVIGGIGAPNVTLNFDPIQPFTKPDDKKIYHTRTNDGSLYSYNIYTKKRWNVPVNWFLKADADTVNGWWSNVESLLYYPDLINYASTYYPVRITNAQRPLLATADQTFENMFEGAIELQEI